MASLRATTADGVSLRVLADNGDAPGTPFLLVHGLASNARLWDGVREAIAATGAAVAAVDLRGHGRSDKPDHGYDFETISADVVAVLDALGWSSAVLAGQSWGGNVVLEVAARHAERVESVACVDGGWIALKDIGPWDVVRERMAPPRLVGMPADVLEGHMRRAHSTWSDAAIAGAMANVEVREDGTIAPWLTFERHMTILRHLWEHDPVSRYPEIRRPVVLMPCDDGSDRVASKRAAIATAERLLPESRTFWFESSHDVHAERPEEVAAILLEEANR